MKPISLYHFHSLPIKTLSLLSTLLILFYGLFILPHSGIDFADAGLTLYSSLSLVDHHFAYDWIALPRPSILMAFFMWLGIRNILLLKISFAVSLLIAIALLGISINKRLWLVLPFAAAIGMYNEPLTLASYENSPAIFLMLGLGFFFLANKNYKIPFAYFTVLASLFFAFSAFTNISVLPASILTILLLSFSDRKQANCLILGFIIFFSIAVYIYGSYVGFENLYRIFASAHSISLLKSIWQKLYGICPLYDYAPAVHWFPRIALLVLLLSALGFLFTINNQNSVNIKLRLVFIATSAYYSCQAVMTDNPLLLPLSYYTAIFSLIVVLCFYNEITAEHARLVKKAEWLFYIGLVFILSAGLYTQLNFSYGNGKTMDNNARLSLPLLNGMYVTPQKAALINKLDQIYLNENCNEKPFIAFYDLPMLYYLFQRSAPLNQSWIQSFSDEKGFPQSAASDDKIQQWINNNNDWCVFYSSGLTNKSNQNMSDLLDASSRTSIAINYNGMKSNIWAESAPLQYEILIK